MSDFCPLEPVCANFGSWKCQFCVTVKARCETCGEPTWTNYKCFKDRFYYERREFKGSLRPLFDHYHTCGNVGFSRRREILPGEKIAVDGKIEHYDARRNVRTGSNFGIDSKISDRSENGGDLGE